LNSESFTVFPSVALSENAGAFAGGSIQSAISNSLKFIANRCRYHVGPDVFEAKT
jgi:hypothetical protein